MYYLALKRTFIWITIFCIADDVRIAVDLGGRSGGRINGIGGGLDASDSLGGTLEVDSGNLSSTKG